MKTIETTEIWITSKELAVLLGVSLRAIEKGCKYKSRYTIGHGRGGKVLEFALSSLPAEVQEKYCSLHGVPLPAVTLCPPTYEYETLYSAKQREAAETKAHIIHKFWRSGLNNTAEFVRRYNAENPGGTITEWQLRDWEDRYKDSGRDPASLIDHRGKQRTGKDSIHPDAWDYFLELVTAPQGRSVQLCYDEVKKKYPDIPGVRTFQRKWEQIPDVLKVKAEGIKDRFDLQLPSTRRDYSTLRSNEIWCFDHHLSDVLVRNRRGKIVRLWMTCIMDIRSRKIMSMYIYDGEPSSTAIKKGFRDAVMKYGIPDYMYTDNGSDYLSQDFDPDVPNSIPSQLDIQKITALPYHGQAKPIERFFNTLEERFSKMCYGYAGNNAKNRPDILKKTNKKLESDKNILDMDVFIDKCTAWIEGDYNERPHSGDGMNGKTPNEVYNAELGEIRRIEDPLRLALICGEHTKRKVRKGRIELMNRTYRGNGDSLILMNGKTVDVRFVPENIDIVYLFDEKGKMIGSATATVRTPFRTTDMNDYREVKREHKEAKKIIREMMPKARMSMLDGMMMHAAEEKHYQSKRDDIEITEKYTVTNEECAPEVSGTRCSRNMRFNTMSKKERNAK